MEKKIKNMLSQKFNQLITSIATVHQQMQSSATNAVNQALTLRNWIIGHYKIEYEQNGKDRAGYGDNLLGDLAKNLAIKGLTTPELSRCRQFYNTYPHILGTLPQDFRSLLTEKILGTLSQEL